MLYYCEFKDAIDRGFINQDTIMTSRINGQLHDYILEGEPIKPHEIIAIEKVSDVLKELETCKFPNITFTTESEDNLKFEYSVFHLTDTAKALINNLDIETNDEFFEELAEV